jgi:hypothetical protein
MIQTNHALSDSGPIFIHVDDVTEEGLYAITYVTVVTDLGSVHFLWVAMGDNKKFQLEANRVLAKY